MIDPNLPLELDDGTPVEFVRASEFGGFYVKFDKAPTRPGVIETQQAWTRPSGFGWTFNRKGIFSSGTSKKQFTLRNVVHTGPEEYEEWFK